MGLRSLFQRKAATSAHVSPVAAAAPFPDTPMSPELLEELRAAWAELTEAAKDSKSDKLPRLHADRPALDGRPGRCQSRSGRTP